MVTLNNIECIIFDLGGVVLNINPLNVRDKLLEYNINNIDTAYEKLNGNNIFNKFEVDDINPHEFRRNVKAAFNKSIPDQLVDKIWNALLLDFPAENIRIIKELKKSYRIFLLSNTNRIHHKAYIAQLPLEHDIYFEDIFEKQFYSFDMKLRKPGTQIFEQAIKEANISAKKTLFIDDTKENIDAAKLTGLNTILIKQNAGLGTVFNS